jgi:subfamily B ATP-binding cassette protein MsbA
MSLFALRRLAPRLAPHRGLLAVAALLLVLSAIIGLAFPLLVRYLMDAAFLERSLPRLRDFALLLFALFAVQGLFNFLDVDAGARLLRRPSIG